MAGKYHYISALAEMTAADIVKNENEWTRFLTTAARLYKYPFNEQMFHNYSRSFPFSRSCSLPCRKMLFMFCLITSYSLTCFFSFP